MPVYPVRLSEEMYERLCERAQQENCPLAALFRQSANAILGSPPINVRLASINEKIERLSCSVDTNRVLLAFLAAYLSRGNIDRKELEKLLANHDAEMSNRRIRHNEKIRELIHAPPMRGDRANE